MEEDLAKMYDYYFNINDSKGNLKKYSFECFNKSLYYKKISAYYDEYDDSFKIEFSNRDISVLIVVSENQLNISLKKEYEDYTKKMIINNEGVSFYKEKDHPFGNGYFISKEGIGYLNYYGFSSSNNLNKFQHKLNKKVAILPDFKFDFVKMNQSMKLVKKEGIDKEYYLNSKDSIYGLYAKIGIHEINTFCFTRNKRSYGLRIFNNDDTVYIMNSDEFNEEGTFKITLSNSIQFEYSIGGDPYFMNYHPEGYEGLKLSRGHFSLYNYHFYYREEMFNITDPDFHWPKYVDELNENKDRGYLISYEKRLNELIGLASVKKMVNRLKAYFIKNKDRFIKSNLNIFFTGNPGTGKTEVARLLAGILYQNRILSENKCIEVDRSTLVGQYIGETENNVKEIIEKSLNGVLFIDEAYSLFTEESDGRDFGSRAIDVLVKAMEDHRGELCIIFAGYKDAMDNLYKMNQGLRSRINRKIDFPNYSIDELKKIGFKFVKDNEYFISDEVMNEVIELIKPNMNDYDFGNARDLRNILESLYEIQAERTIDDLTDRIITLKDIDIYKKEKNNSKNSK